MNRTTTFYQQIEIDLSEVTYATYVLRPMTSQKYWPIRFHDHDLKYSTGWRQVNHSRQQAFEDHLPPEWLDCTIEDKSEIEN